MVTGYYGAILLSNALVNWLLLMGASRLCGHYSQPVQTALGAVIGGIYACLCLLPGFRFLTGFLWYGVISVTVFLVGYGFTQCFRRGIVFLLLHMALRGLTLGSNSSIWTLLGATFAVGSLFLLGFGKRIGVPYVPVELSLADRHLKLTALHDTGNTLKDPVTGSPVLVVDCDTAVQLTGLTVKQLQQPVESIGTLPGLRLIPYRTVGTEAGLLLGMLVPKVRIGKWQGMRMVAFAPGKLSADGKYQALTGGIV